MSFQNALQDRNRFSSIIVAQGTLGTSDVRGTAETMYVGGNPATGAMYVHDLSGAGGTTNVSIANGTINRVHDLGTMGTAVGVGTLSNLGSVTNVATLHNGTVVMPSGTVTSVTNIASGTIAALASGTITGGTLQNLVSGTINALASGTITGGTLGNLNNGTLALVTTVSNLAAGTIRIDQTPTQQGTALHTRGTTGAAVWGTLVAAAGAGTRQFVSGVDVVVASGTVDVAVTNIGIGGSTGAGVLARGQFTPGGGITKPLDPVQRSGTNGTLAFWMGGAGTVDVTVNYWQST